MGRNVIEDGKMAARAGPSPAVGVVASPRPESLRALFDTGADPQTLRAGGRVLFEERAS
jgi:hypothetical protein